MPAKLTKARRSQIMKDSWARRKNGKQPASRRVITSISDQDEKIAEVAYTLGWLGAFTKEAYPVIKSSRKLASTPMGQLILSLKGR